MSWEEGEAPEGWTLAELGDVVKVIGGGTPKTSVPGNFSESEGHPWITPADLTRYTDKYITRGKRFLTDQGLATSSAKYIPAGSVLFSTRAPVGYVAVAANPVTTNQGFRSFVPNGKVDSEYIYYALKFLTPLAEQLASGTTFAELSGSKAAKLPIAYPALEEQRAIVSALDIAAQKSGTAKVHILAARRAVDRFRQAVLTAACSGALTSTWRDENSTSSAARLVEELEEARSDVLGSRAKPPTAIAEVELPEIPPTWNWVSVDALAERVVDGVHKTPTYVEEGIPFLTVRNLTAGKGISFDNVRYITQAAHDEYIRRTHPEPGDILISKDGTIGVTRAVRTDRPFSIFVSLAMVKPLVYDMSDYLELALSSPLVQRQMLGVGSGLQHLVLRDLKADGIPVPPMDEQAEIVRRVDQLLALADSLQQRIEIASTRVARSSQAVLAKAFRGQLHLNGTAE
jgi:type I restriction enzyme S subunit